MSTDSGGAGREDRRRPVTADRLKRRQQTREKAESYNRQAYDGHSQEAGDDN